MRSDKTGLRYGLLTVVSTSVNGQVLVQCDCGSPMMEMAFRELQCHRLEDCGCVMKTGPGVWNIYGTRYRSLEEAAKARGVRPATVRKWVFGNKPRSDCTFEPVKIRRPMQTYIPCTKCNERQMVPLASYQIEAFKKLLPRHRPNIQDMYPELTPDQREMLKSGYCPKCWDKIFPDPDEIRKVAIDEARRPHHAIPSGHSDGEGYDGGDR